MPRSDTADKEISELENITLEVIKSEAQINKMLRIIPRG